MPCHLIPTSQVATTPGGGEPLHGHGHQGTEKETAFVSTPAITVLSHLLPDTTSLRLEACYVDKMTTQITLRVRSTQTRVPCPLCAIPASRIHSRYERTLADLPWAAYRVRLELRVRKWFCANPDCVRRIFTERLPMVAAPWARRTLRLAHRLLALGVALGGRAGVRLGHAWDLVVSRHTLLRGLHRHPVPALPTPTVLGVDDFALRKGQTYGTVLIDLERRQPVALLPDRTAETLAQWLREHPGVQVIARDRATAYADGARHGAPAATQVADRWHLLRNLAEALEHVFHQHRTALQEIHVPSAVLPLALADQPAVIEAPAPSPTAPPTALLPPAAGASPRHTHRRLRYEQVCHLAQHGWTFQAIARQVGLHRKTVAQYVRSDSYPIRARPPSMLDPYKPYLLARWNAGCRTGMRLYEDLQRQGYRGGRSTVLGYLTQLRKAQGLAPRTRMVPPVPPVTDPTVQCLTPRQATWLTLRRPEHVTEDEQQLLVQLHQAHPAFAQAIALAQDFARLLRARQPDKLEAWLQQAATSALVVFRRLAHSFQRDYAAVKAGVTLPWSSGPVEGQINRLKMLKRQMFGRARLDLLSCRFVLAPQTGQGQAPGQPIPAQAHQAAAAA
jgi:transposase